eukprot:364783-Chlamydomonas_euryale.AAC.8
MGHPMATHWTAPCQHACVHTPASPHSPLHDKLHRHGLATVSPAKEIPTHHVSTLPLRHTHRPSMTNCIDMDWLPSGRTDDSTGVVMSILTCSRLPPVQGGAYEVVKGGGGMGEAGVYPGNGERAMCQSCPSGIARGCRLCKGERMRW